MLQAMDATGNDGRDQVCHVRGQIPRKAELLREKDELIRTLHHWQEEAANHVSGLTPRHRKIMELVLGGRSSKASTRSLASANALSRTVALRSCGKQA
jgi:hypothetical protein